MRGAGVFSPRPVATSSDTARVVATAGTTAVKGSFAVTVEALARADVRTQSSTLTAAVGRRHAARRERRDRASTSRSRRATASPRSRRRSTPSAAASAPSVVDGRLRLTATATGAADGGGAVVGRVAGGRPRHGGHAGRPGRALHGRRHRRARARTNRVADAIPGVTLDLRAATAGAPVTVTADPVRDRRRRRGREGEGAGRGVQRRRSTRCARRSARGPTRPARVRSRRARSSADDLYEGLLGATEPRRHEPGGGARRGPEPGGHDRPVDRRVVRGDVDRLRCPAGSCSTRRSCATRWPPTRTASPRCSAATARRGIAARLDSVLTGATSRDRRPDRAGGGGDGPPRRLPLLDRRRRTCG